MKEDEGRKRTWKEERKVRKKEEEGRKKEEEGRKGGWTKGRRDE